MDYLDSWMDNFEGWAKTWKIEMLKKGWSEEKIQLSIDKSRIKRNKIGYPEYRQSLELSNT